MNSVHANTAVQHLFILFHGTRTLILPLAGRGMWSTLCYILSFDCVGKFALWYNTCMISLIIFHFTTIEMHMHCCKRIIVSISFKRIDANWSKIMTKIKKNIQAMNNIQLTISADRLNSRFSMWVRVSTQTQLIRLLISLRECQISYNIKQAVNHIHR